MKRAVLVAAVLLLLAPPTLAQRGGRYRPQESDIQALPQILRFAINASQRLKYSGERVIEFKRGVERVSHRELILRDGPRMRIEFPEGSRFTGQVIVENGRDRLHYFPDREEIHVLPPRTDETRSRLIMLAGKVARKGHRFELGGSESIASVFTRVVSVFDSNGNPVQRLWVDPNRGLVMKRELYDKSGAVAGSFEFVRVNFSPSIESGDFTIRRRGAKIVRPEDNARRLASEAGIRLALLPPDTGYRLESARLLKRSEVPVLVQSYTSKGGQLSLFQVVGPINEERLRKFARGEFTVYSWTRGNQSLALVGSLDRERLRNIARKLGAD